MKITLCLTYSFLENGSWWLVCEPLNVISSNYSTYFILLHRAPGIKTQYDPFPPNKVYNRGNLDLINKITKCYIHMYKSNFLSCFLKKESYISP